MHYGPTTAFADQLHAEKYRGTGEDFREFTNRWCGALADNDEEFAALRPIIGTQRFLPGGRTQAAVGSPRGVTAYNCFVSGTIMDSYVHDPGCIMDRAKEAAATMRMGGGIGYNFGTLRPRDALIVKLDSRASGPISFMGIFDAVCRCTASSSNRRGAQMAVLPIWHPDIEEFIHSKQNDSSLTGFNISVGVTDEFMECLINKRPFTLRWGGQNFRKIDPVALWEMLMRSTWDWAEPGVLFIDTINKQNNLNYCETIVATNPCGEQPLPPFGACLLGSFNLTQYIIRNRDVARPFVFDFRQFERDIPHVVRAMDNIVDVSSYPLPEQEVEAKDKRRMGLGVTGLANAIEVLGHPYGSPDFIVHQQAIMETLRNGAYMASAYLAAEKGAFPAFNKDRYMNAPFIRNLPAGIRALIEHNGNRNSHLTSFAPCGTISMTADSISSGIENVFAHEMDRWVRMQDGRTQVTVKDYGVATWGSYGKTAQEVTLKQHLDVLAACVPYVDSSVSKTVNVPPDTPWANFKELYVEAWRRGCKGLTTFNTGGKRKGILTETPQVQEGSSCEIDDQGRMNCE